MMSTVTTKLMTAEEFFEWANAPENWGKNCDLVCGEIVEMSRPGRQHGAVCGNVARILGVFTVQEDWGYVCPNDTGIITERDPDTVRGPDLMLFEDADDFDDVDLKYGEELPLLAVEVLSPNDIPGKVSKKIVEQLALGTPLVWVLDPAARNVTVYQPGKQPYVVGEGQAITGEEVLPGFTCQVSEFFKVRGKRKEKPSQPPGVTKVKPPRKRKA